MMGSVEFEAIDEDESLTVDYDDDSVTFTVVSPDGEASTAIDADEAESVAESLNAWLALRYNREHNLRCERCLTCLQGGTQTCLTDLRPKT